jgi:amidohydrolase
MDIAKLKLVCTGTINRRQNELIALSLKIHANPELGFHETKSAEWLTQFLQDNSFTVQKGICGLDTAFRASYGKGKPTIAIVAEYDALPKLGHACGHNIIAVSTMGAALAGRMAVDQLGGTVVVIGTPAEEGQGGKAIMIDGGAFKDIDAAMMVHPGAINSATCIALAAQVLDVEYFGRAAHAAASPELGINALDAMVLAFSGINALRQHIDRRARIHGIITDGGQAANIIPEHTAANFLIRAADLAYLADLRERVLGCFTGAALATGARLEYKWAERFYQPMNNNMVMAGLFKTNLEELGRKVHLEWPGESFFSTDMGNVSQVVPAIHPFIAVSMNGAAPHTPEFAEAAASETGMKGMLDAAKSMAMTVIDLLASPDKLKEAQKEFGTGK